MSGLKVQLQGVPQAVAALGKLGQAIQRKHIRIALNAVGGVLKPEVVKRAPRDTGTLAKNQIVKVKVNAKKGTAYALIGAKRGVKVSVTNNKGKRKVLATWKTRKDGTLTVTGQKKYEKAIDAGKQIRYRVPSRYSHLVEKGTKRGVTARRYLERAAVAGRNRAAEAAIKKLREGVAEETRKARTKAR